MTGRGSGGLARGAGLFALLALALLFGGIVGLLIVLGIIVIRQQIVVRSHEHLIEDGDLPRAETIPRFDAQELRTASLATRGVRVALAAADYALLVGMHYVGAVLTMLLSADREGMVDAIGPLVAVNVEQGLVVSLCVIPVLALGGRYRRAGRAEFRPRDLLFVLFFGVALATLTRALLADADVRSVLPMALTTWGLAALLLPVPSSLVDFFVRRGLLGAPLTLWIGEPGVVEVLAASSGRMQFARRLDDDDDTIAAVVEELSDPALADRLGRILIAYRGERVERALEILVRFEGTGVPAMTCIDLGMAGRFAHGSRTRLANGLLQVESFSGQRRWLSFSVKRLVDVVGALVGLALCALPLAVLALVIRRDGGHAFFRHERIGRLGLPFDCLKLRTMRMDSEAILERVLAESPEAREEWARDFKLRDDPRITRVGAFLRRTSLDELPQLWNVLKGDMSLVGPRPVVAAELATYYRESAELYRKVRPGLTGPWQVGGRNDLSYAERVALDAHYALNWSFSSDVMIILRTLGVFFERKGAY